MALVAPQERTERFDVHPEQITRSKSQVLELAAGGSLTPSWSRLVDNAHCIQSSPVLGPNAQQRTLIVDHTVPEFRRTELINSAAFNRIERCTPLF